MTFSIGRGLARLREGLARTRARLGEGVRALVTGRSGLDETTWEGLEEVLLGADVGAVAADEIVGDVRRAAAGWSSPEPERVFEELRRSIETRLAGSGGALQLSNPDGPSVVLLVGVNGSGKTTTAGKLASRLVREDRRVLVVAADTFRAAAVEQLGGWAERAGVPIVKGKEGADAAAVVHDGLTAAVARGCDVVLVDTAGRLHTKTSLMDELAKVRRVAARVVPGAPHEVLLVLDATNGQNAIAQARQFHEALGVTGIALTKLDGTAKGGVVIGITDELGIPVRYVGVGERVADLQEFSPAAFVRALFEGRS